MSKVDVNFKEVWQFACKRYGDWDKLPASQLMRALRATVSFCCEDIPTHKIGAADVIIALRKCAVHAIINVPARADELLQALISGVVNCNSRSTDKTDLIARQLLRFLASASKSTGTDDPDAVVFVIGEPDKGLIKNLKPYFSNPRIK